MEDATKRHWAWVVVTAAIIACIIILFVHKPAHAGDLGGSCCADLEDRIAELEATVATKGNRKVSLTVSGQINEAWTYVNLDGFHDNKIGNNGNDDSYLRIAGGAKVTPDVAAGYVLEINVSELGLLNSGLSSNEPLTRQSFWFIKSERFGQISLGKQSQATNDFDKFSTNSAWLAGKPLSVGSLSDLYLTGVDLPFDGDYRNVVKYVSPELAGFTLAATWGPTVDGSFLSGGTGNGFDVALRYDSKENIKDIHAMAAVGYRRSTDLEINALNLLNIQIPTGDVDTVLVTGSMMHLPTGLFVNGEFVDQKWQDAFGGFTLRGYDVTGGVHEKWIPLGATEVFGSWGRVSFDQKGSTDIDYYGLGATQALDAAAMSLYLGWKHYNTQDVLTTDVDAVTAGAVVKF